MFYNTVLCYHMIINIWLYSREMEYTGALVLSELITGAVTYIKVYGKGSADEQHVHLQ